MVFPYEKLLSEGAYGPLALDKPYIRLAWPHSYSAFSAIYTMISDALRTSVTLSTPVIHGSIELKETARWDAVRREEKYSALNIQVIACKCRMHRDVVGSFDAEHPDDL